MIEKSPKHVRLFEKIGLAAGNDPWNSDAGIQQSLQQVTLLPRHNSGEHAAATEFRLPGIFSDPANYFVVFILPHEIVRIERSTMGLEECADFRGPGYVYCVACRIAVPIRVSAMSQ